MVIYKFFTLANYEKKEKWINDMCSKGYALKKFSFFKYEFEPCNPGEYYYSLELFESLPCTLEHQDFLNYLDDEWNIEYVHCHYNWAFFRRKKYLGKFSLFSNVHTKVSYFKRVVTHRLILISLLIVFSIVDFIYSIPDSTDITFAVIVLSISIMTLIVNIPTFIKFLKLKKSDDY